MSLLSTSVRSSISPFFTPSNLSIQYFFSACQDSVGSQIVYTSYCFANVALLPLYAFVLLVGLRRWRRQRSAAAGATMSHSDFFTFQMMMVEMLNALGSIVICFGNYLRSEPTFLVSILLLGFVIPGQTLFHVLACVERYLAVVHAISYMRLRDRVKVRVRDLSTGAVWLSSLGWSGLIWLYLPNFPTDVLMPSLAICLVITSFCCLSLLRFLRRPTPGDGGGSQQRSDQSKKRAFNMISAITASLALRIFGLLVCLGIKTMVSIETKDLCPLIDSGIWLTVPSNLVLPLLFLHRAGKL